MRVREYELLEILGKGGMGAVYRARHELLGVERAVKIVQPAGPSSEIAKERFIREARLLTELHHPNLVQCFEFGMLEPGTFFMVMELIRGESIRTLLQRTGKIPFSQAIQIVKEAALGLQCAHERGVLHRDISPDNLVIASDSSGREITKVIDFGIAKPLLEESVPFTQADSFIGKPQYASPEQCGFIPEAETLDARSDIYSLGITLYQMISGKLPFYSPTPHGYLVKHMKEIKPLKDYAGTLEQEDTLNQIIRRSTAPDRQARYSSLEDLIRDLSALQSTVPDFLPVASQDITPSALAETISPGRFNFLKRKNIVIPLIALFITIVGTIWGFIIHRRAGEPDHQASAQIGNAPSHGPAGTRGVGNTSPPAKPRKFTFTFAREKGESKQYTGKAISVDFKNEDVVHAFQNIAQRAGLNVVVDPGIKGNVTLSLRNVPWDQALDIICEDHYLEYEKKGNIVYISMEGVMGESDMEKEMWGESPFGASPKRITVNYVNEDIHHILKDLSMLTGFEMVADRALTARLSVKAHDIPWPLVLQRICVEHGLMFELEAKKISVSPGNRRLQFSKQQDDAASDEPFSFDFDDIQIKDFFSFMGQVSGMNFIVDPEVTGKIDVNVKDMPWEEALRIVCKSNNLGYTISGSNVRIAPLSKLIEEEKKSKYLPKIPPIQKKPN